MDSNIDTTYLPSFSKKNMKKSQLQLRSLRLSLKYRPEIFRLIQNLKLCIRKKNVLLRTILKQLGLLEKKVSDLDTNNDNIKLNIKDASTQTDKPIDKNEDEIVKSVDVVPKSPGAWNLECKDGTEEKSIAEQVKEVAQSALQETGMVYVESAGMYYDYKTGYYYNSELGLYYHTDTSCYYYYSNEKQTFVFHSYPDRSMKNANAALEAHEKRKARKNKRERKADEIEDLTKNLAQVSLLGQTALESVARHHPPCMRVIVRESNLPKLKVGSLFLITKDGGTVGREGDGHAILIRDHNVSRNHMEIKYDENSRKYLMTDLGSKNGSILNGSRMSESQVVSEPLEVVHGSMLQLGEVKLLCHIHPGNDTCGHCEPGLLLETLEKEKVAYTRTCSVQKQHQLELARLKNKYAPKLPAIEATAYNDRASARRRDVGSSHHSEKTQANDVDTFIAPENKGFKLLEKMGWAKGEGLGKDKQGDVEPIPLVGNEGKVGLGGAGSAVAPSSTPKPKNKLGSATLRLASKTKMLQPPAKAFQVQDDDEDLE